MKWGNWILTLTPDEYEKVTRAVNGTGGHQRLMRTVLERLDHKQKTLDLSPAQLGRVRTYAKAYGGGGYQDRFKAILAAAERSAPRLRRHKI